jgi:hypothetical protein
MGLGLALLRDLIELKRRGFLDCVQNVIEIGDQQLNDSLIEAPELTELYRLFGRDDPPVLAAVGSENFTEQAPSSLAFWQGLGLNRTAVDIVGNAIRIDLNSGRVMRALRGKYDLLINAGTTEHVVNQGNAFEIIHDLCRVGAVMYHELPAGGMIDHGMISYQPKFFRHLAAANDYEILFIRYSTHGKASVPVYLQNDTIKDEISECALRVALRKRHRGGFSVPWDATYVPLIQQLRKSKHRIAAALRRRLFQ